MSTSKLEPHIRAALAYFRYSKVSNHEQARRVADWMLDNPFKGNMLCQYHLAEACACHTPNWREWLHGNGRDRDGDRFVHWVNSGGMPDTSATPTTLEKARPYLVSASPSKSYAPKNLYEDFKSVKVNPYAWQQPAEEEEEDEEEEEEVEEEEEEEEDFEFVEEEEVEAAKLEQMQNPNSWRAWGAYPPASSDTKPKFRGFGFGTGLSKPAGSSSGKFAFGPKTTAPPAAKPAPKPESLDGPAYQRIEKLHTQLTSHRDGTNFLTQFNDKSSPEYTWIIKKPIDLGTVWRNLTVRKTYTTLAEWSADIRIMFENALIYYAPGSEAYQAAERLSKFMETQYMEIKRSLNIRSNYDPPIQRTEDWCLKIYTSHYDQYRKANPQAPTPVGGRKGVSNNSNATTPTSGNFGYTQTAPAAIQHAPPPSSTKPTTNPYEVITKLETSSTTSSATATFDPLVKPLSTLHISTAVHAEPILARTAASANLAPKIGSSGVLFAMTDNNARFLINTTTQSQEEILKQAKFWNRDIRIVRWDEVTDTTQALAAIKIALNDKSVDDWHVVDAKQCNLAFRSLPADLLA